MERRALLRLVAIFAASLRSGRLVAAAASDEQNGWAIDQSSNFKAIYGDPQLKAAFFLFLKNVFHLYPEDRFQTLIENAAQSKGTDRDIYREVQRQLKSIKPFFGDVTYALPALRTQKAEMTRQTLELLGGTKKIDGYMEVGTTGRYLSTLRSSLDVKGDVVLVHTSGPSFAPGDIIERGGLLKVGRFVSMRGYAPVAAAAVRDESLDLVTNFIGFHHAPLDRLEPFARSFHRVLRKGGRMIVRDHEVNSPAMNRMVALAHDVFNLGLKTDWAINQQEIRYFTSIAQLVTFLERIGFKPDGRTLFQDGDPTKNALMVFAKA